MRWWTKRYAWRRRAFWWHEVGAAQNRLRIVTGEVLPLGPPSTLEDMDEALFALGQAEANV